MNFKKLVLTSIFALSICTLVACRSNQTKTDSDNSSQIASVSKQETKDTGQKLFQPVLDRYKTYETVLTSRNKNRLSETLKQKDIPQEEIRLIDNLGNSGTNIHFKSTFLDLDKDGQDELLISQNNKISAIYHNKNNHPELFSIAYIAPVGGTRLALTIYENGKVVSAGWQASNPEVSLSQYKFEKSIPQKEKEDTMQLGGSKTIEDVLAITSKPIDLTSLTWDSINKNSSSDKMNIREIQNGNFSSIAGTWRNSEGNSVTFDANGVTHVNGKPSDGIVFEKFLPKENNLIAFTKTPQGESEKPFFFVPIGDRDRNYSEYIFWSNEHVTDGKDLYFRE